MKSRSLSPTEKLAWLRLIMSENIGPITLFRLLKQFGSAEVAIDYVAKFAATRGRRNITVCPPEKASAEMQRAESKGIQIIALIEPEYPELLRYIEDAPPIIYAKGNINILQNRQVAIVGARNATLAAKNLAKQIAHDLSTAGITVTSGLARGIDSSAHNGALLNTEANSPATIAVMANGLDADVYPPENKDLFKTITERGVCISEMPLGTQPMAPYFPRRNRIISGMSLATAIIEAEERSGSLITARLALEQGREVFAVPGSPMDPRAKGPNKLLKQGAMILENAQDILDNLPNHPKVSEPDLFDFDSSVIKPDEIKDTTDIKSTILENISYVACDMDELFAEVGCDLQTFSLALLELELEGLAAREASNRVVKL